MRKKNNVNPDHYKEEGRERPGQDVVQEIHKQKFTQSQPEKEGGSKFIPGSAPVLNESPAKDVENDAGQAIESANSSSKT